MATATAADPACEVLELLANAADVAAAPPAVAAAWQQAAAEHPGDLADAWEARLRRACAALGLHAVPSPLSPREAVAHTHRGAPMVTCQPDADGRPAWLVLDGRQGNTVRAARPGAEPGQRWVGAGELARLAHAADAGSRVVWLLVHSATPATDRSHEAHHAPDAHSSSPDGHGHDAGHRYAFRQLLRLLKPERGDLLTVLVFAVGIGIFTLVTPIAVEELVNTIARGTYLQPLVVMTLVMAGCLGLAALMRGVQTVVVEVLQQRLFVRIVGDLAYRLPRVRQLAFDQQDGPELVNRFFDVLTLQKAVASLLLDGLAVVIYAAVGLIVLAFYHPYLLAFDLAFVAAILGIVWYLGRNAVQTSINESKAKYATAFWLQGIVFHPRAFKQAGGADLAWHEADSLARAYVHYRRQHFRILFRQIAFALGLEVVASAALLGVGGWLVIDRQLTLGQLVAAQYIVALVASSLVKLGKSLEAYYDLLAATDKLGHLLDLPLERQDGEAPRGEADPRGAAVAVRSATFTYVGTTRKVFDGLTLELQPGERVGLVGGSGSGKSTLVELLFGMRVPQEGYVALDGMDLRDLRLEQVRDQVAIVQGLEIFDGTVAENVLMGRTQFGVSDVRRALDQVGLLDEMLALPHGLQSYLLNGGRSMSVGHAQQLMVARAILGKPRLLVLDETLDTVDTEVRWRLLPYLTAPERPWTLLIVTRRPEILDLCDRTLTLQRSAPGAPARLVTRAPADLRVAADPEATP